MKAATIIGLGLLTSASFASHVQAQETALETLLSSYVEHAVTMTAEEINLSAQQAVANFAHHFDIDMSSPKGAVNVTDLVANNTQVEDIDTSDVENTAPAE